MSQRPLSQAFQAQCEIDWIFVVCRIEPLTSHMLIKYSVTKPQPQLSFYLYILTQKLAKLPRLALNSPCIPGRPWAPAPASASWVAEMMGQYQTHSSEETT